MRTGTMHCACALIRAPVRDHGRLTRYGEVTEHNGQGTRLRLAVRSAVKRPPLEAFFPQTGLTHRDLSPDPAQRSFLFPPRSAHARSQNRFVSSVKCPERSAYPVLVG